MLLGPAASAPPGNLFKMQILLPHPRSTGSESLGAGPSNLCFNQPSRNYCTLSWGTTDVRYLYPTGDAWYTERSDGLDQITWVALKKYSWLGLTCRDSDLIDLGLGLCIHVFFFLPTFYYEYFQTYKAVKRLHSEHRYTRHLDSITNILLYFPYHASVYPCIHPFYFLVHFKVSCRHQTHHTNTSE